MQLPAQEVRIAIVGYTRATYVDMRMVAARPLHLMGVTGFDRVVLRWAAGRGLLATLNRGTVKLN